MCLRLAGSTLARTSQGPTTSPSATDVVMAAGAGAGAAAGPAHAKTPTFGASGTTGAALDKIGGVSAVISTLSAGGGLPTLQSSFVEVKFGKDNKTTLCMVMAVLRPSHDKACVNSLYVLRLDDPKAVFRVVRFGGSAGITLAHPDLFTNYERFDHILAPMNSVLDTAHMSPSGDSCSLDEVLARSGALGGVQSVWC